MHDNTNENNNEFSTRPTQHLPSCTFSFKQFDNHPSNQETLIPKHHGFLPIIEGNTQETTRISPDSNQNEPALDYQFEPHSASSGRKRKHSLTITMALCIRGLMLIINPLQPKYLEFLNMTQFGFDIAFSNLNFAKMH